MDKKYTFIRKNPETGKETPEDVKILRWVWGVVYEDGTELHQYDDKGVFHQVGEIDQKRARLFVLYRPDDPKKRIDIPMNPGMRLIYKYKVVKATYLPRPVRVYCLGFKAGVHHTFMFILPDDRIIMTNKETVDLPNYELTIPEKE